MDPLPEHKNPIKTLAVTLDAAEEPVAAIKPHTLVGLQSDFAFFTLGVMYAAIPSLSRDLFKDFLRTVPSLMGGGAGAFSGGGPVFSGLGTRIIQGVAVNMDHLIYAVHKSMWEDCRGYIGGTAFIDAPTGGTYRTVVYTMPLVDRATLQQTRIVTALPTVPLTVFAVNGPQRFCYLSVPEYPALATLKSMPAKTAAELAAMETL